MRYSKNSRTTRILLLIITLCSTISFNTNAQITEQDYPDWFVYPQTDTEEYLYSVFDAPTFSGALIKSLSSLAMKIESKVDGLTNSYEDDENGDAKYSYTSQTVSTQTFGLIKVSTMQKLYQEEISRDDGTQISSSFNWVSKLSYSVEEEGSLVIEFYVNETEMEEDTETAKSVKVAEDRITIADLVSYMKSSGLFIIRTESLQVEAGHHYFMEVGLNLNAQKESLQKETDEIKNNKAVQELMKQFSEDQDDQ